MRSWKSALDQINYYKAYSLSSNYSPKSETERALWDSLRELEAQCKERVDLLETLKRSRDEVGIQQRKEERKEHRNGNVTGRGHGNGSGSGGGKDGRKRLGKSKADASPATTPKPEQHASWLGGETVPPMQMSELPHATPALPPRPPLAGTRSSDLAIHESSPPISRVRSSPLGVPPTLAVPQMKVSRSPSPDHGRKPMRTTLRPEKRGFMKYRSSSNRDRQSETMTAAGLAWGSQPRKNSYPQRPDSDPSIEARLSATAARRSIDQEATTRYEEQRKSNASSLLSAPDNTQQQNYRDVQSATTAPTTSMINKSMESLKLTSESAPSLIDLDSESERPPPPQYAPPLSPPVMKARTRSPVPLPKAPEITYRREYPPKTHNVPQPLARNILERAYNRPASAASTGGISRKPVGTADTTLEARGRSPPKRHVHTDSEEETPKRHLDRPRRPKGVRAPSANDITPPSTDGETLEDDESLSMQEKRMQDLLKDLPKGLDENAAKQILNEIVVKGDEVHWEDVAGLGAAKKALKEAVVYPFLRPDLFMGLREPARGMLLFGPPGTGKTMLARAVATESKSTFFAISASSLTSKWHGESEKLVRALFALAKALAPSIIFVDEIDSLLSARSGSSEHEASRRSKTEFLIQWSDLQRAAAGNVATVGDASRVLVLAATNCPWDIDDAARRRFVRRQYIPLPESETRLTQILTLLGHQKHDLSDEDIARLVVMTDGKCLRAAGLRSQAKMFQDIQGRI